MRLTIFGAMAALLVVALCVPEAFDDLGLLFACAYAIVRGGPDRALRARQPRRSRAAPLGHGLAVSTAIGVGLLWRPLRGRRAPGRLWALALALDMGGPYLFGSEGWKLMPGHFAERHGLIVIIALGESIVAIGVGAEVGVDAGVVVAAVLGIAVAAALWWLYFDIVALVAERRLSNAAPGREQQRDRARLVLVPALPDGRRHRAARARPEEDARHVGDPLKLVPAVALLGGTAIYLLAHVAFRRRNIHAAQAARWSARCCWWR